MARTWLISGRGIAKKVKNATRISNYQIKELGIEAHRECPNCSHLIDNSDVSLEWPGFPAGVKFDPTDAEILEHLAGKIGLSSSKSHMFIDEFIPTLKEDQGICYTHPKNLPGVKQDGSSIHFFHRISNAYATGQRKRRKINNNQYSSLPEEQVRWHKTGKTKPIIDNNGVQKGWKKIMVLYRSLKKCGKPDKANWVMHQYHLGMNEDEKDGEMVVSKIFFQQTKQTDKSDAEVLNEESANVGNGPRTPKLVTPLLRRQENQSPLSEIQELKNVEIHHSVSQQNDDEGNSQWLAGESQADEEFDPNAMDKLLLCHEVLDNFAPIHESSMFNNEMLDKNLNSSGLFCDFGNIPFDSPPDFSLKDLQFGSQDSISSWLDRL